MSLWTRARACWEILIKGEYTPDDYRSRHAQKQWNICEQRRRDLEVSTRPRSDCPESEYMDQ
jgi:hypothetical protein